MSAQDASEKVELQRETSPAAQSLCEGTAALIMLETSFVLGIEMCRFVSGLAELSVCKGRRLSPHTQGPVEFSKRSPRELFPLPSVLRFKKKPFGKWDKWMLFSKCCPFSCNYISTTAEKPQLEKRRPSSDFSDLLKQ